MSAAVTHYVMTLSEHRAALAGEYVDPDRYKERHRDYHPEMLCRTGDGHAQGSRLKHQITCPRCIEALNKGT